MKALSSLGQLQWFKLSAGPHPVYLYEHVPYVAWRFTAPTRESIDTILDAVHSAPSDTEWVLDTSRKNWILAPARVIRISGGADSELFHEATQEVINRDQNFCRKALEDFDAVLASLEQRIRDEAEQL